MKVDILTQTDKVIYQKFILLSSEEKRQLFKKIRKINNLKVYNFF